MLRVTDSHFVLSATQLFKENVTKTLQEPNFYIPKHLLTPVGDLRGYKHHEYREFTVL